MLLLHTARPHLLPVADVSTVALAAVAVLPAYTCSCPGRVATLRQSSRPTSRFDGKVTHTAVGVDDAGHFPTPFIEMRHVSNPHIHSLSTDRPFVTQEALAQRRVVLNVALRAAPGLA